MTLPVLLRRRAPSLALFKYRAGANLASLGGTFTRVVTGTYRDANGFILTAAGSVLRDAHYPTIGGPRTTLLENGRNNRCLQSNTLATSPWAAVNCTPANAYATYAGLPFSRVSGIGATSSLVQNIAFSGNGTKTISFFVHADGVVAGVLSVILYDLTALTTRVSVLLTISAAGVVTSDTGTVTPCAQGVYRVAFTAAGGVAVDTNQLFIVNPSANNTLASVLITGVQAEDATFESSLIPSTTVVAGRGVEVLSFAFPKAIPATGLTVFADFVELGTFLLNNQGHWSIGDDGTAGAWLESYSSSTNIRGQWYDGGTAKTSTATSAPAMGDRLEVLCTLQPSGIITTAFSQNGGALVSGAPSTGLAFPVGWNVGVVQLGQLGTSPLTGFTAFRSFIIMRGIWTLAAMRDIARKMRPLQ